MDYRFGLSAAFLALLSTTAACGTGSRDDAVTGDQAAFSGSELAPSDVDAAMTKLDAQRNGATFGTFYADGTRVEGCWRNPVGKNLTDLQKSFYCSMPLEFRICNSVVLLTVDESNADGRFNGYLDCQKKVDAVFGSKGQFVYDDGINQVYRQLMIEKAPLADDDTSRIVAATKPSFSSRSFPIIVAAIVASVLDEAVKLSVDGLRTLLDDYKAAVKADPS